MKRPGDGLDAGQEKGREVISSDVQGITLDGSVRGRRKRFGGRW